MAYVAGFALSRSLSGFLVFCLLLAAASAAVVWYVGPALAGIVIDESRREQPYRLLQLLPAEAVAGADGIAYGTRFVELAAADEGRLLWRGGGVSVMEGSVRLDVAAVQLVEFARGADLVQMLTGSGFRALASELDARRVHHLGTTRPPGEIDPNDATVLVLYRTDSAAAAPLGVPGEAGWLALLPRYGGTVRWDTPVTPLKGRAPWNRALLLQFESAAGAEDWYEDPRTATERAIARKHVDDVVALLVQPASAGRRWNSRTVRNSSKPPRFGNVSAAISSSSR